MFKSVLTVAVAAVTAAVHAAAPPVAPDLITVGDAGNPGRPMPFGELKKAYPRGAVGYPYRIAAQKVSNREYAAFLNAVAADRDPGSLYRPEMAIVRRSEGGTAVYAARPGSENEPVRYVNRAAAARYCNWLSGAEVYHLAVAARENGSRAEALVGRRNLTDPTAPRLYYLPDIHEFYKAAFYDGKGGYPEVAAADRNRPSHYGLRGYASGPREWMENKYHAGATILLGASDDSKNPGEINGRLHRQFPEASADRETGFRVAATASIAIAPLLNRRNNFFTAPDDAARLRLRYDGAPGRRLALGLVLTDYAGKTVRQWRQETELKPGVTDLPVELPRHDGYFELKVTPADPSCNGRAEVIPLMIMREPMPDWKRDGNFGFTVHITRWERRFTFEPVDFDLLRRLGAGIIRVDVQYHDTAGSQTALKRIYDQGFRPLAIITSGGINNYETLEKNRREHSELVEKWARHGVPAMAAWYAENVYNLVKANRAWTRDWELGNEPTYWRILAEDYAQLARAGYLAAKLADPDCNVMLGDVNAIHVPVFTVRGGRFCDSIASHIYGFYVPSFWGIIGKMRELNAWKAAAGFPDKPVWLTEIGVCTYNHMHTLPLRSLDEVKRYQAVHVPKAMAGGRAFGAAKVLNYNYRDVPVDSLEEEFGMIDRYGLPKPAAMSYRTTARLLGNAAFRGFLQGHSAAPGKIAGLAFRDAAGRDVVVFWRNDRYGESRFEIPLDKMIKAPQNVTLPVAGAVTLITLDGQEQPLAARNGAVSVPVNEYPVFVRGRINPALTPVSLLHRRPVMTFPDARVKILPPEDNRTKACDLMSGVFTDLAAGENVPVTVHVYNLQDRELNGTLRLEPPQDWRSWSWNVAPAAAPLRLPPFSMGAVRFTVAVPRTDGKPRPGYLTAVFTAGPGTEFSDKVQCRVVPPQFELSHWITYAKGYRLGLNDDRTELEISRDADAAYYASCYLRTPRPFAADAAGMKRQFTLPYRTGKLPLRNISLMLLDRQGEFFQIKKAVRPQPGQWEEITFEASDALRPGKFISYGGNRDKKIDYPVKFLGFNFDFDRGDRSAGTMSVRRCEVRGE